MDKVDEIVMHYRSKSIEKLIAHGYSVIIGIFITCAFMLLFNINNNKVALT